MNEIRYQIKLLKDAELGTGLGSSSTNSLLPRDSDGWPVIPASHVKGLARAALKEIAAARTSWQSAFPVDDTTSDGRPGQWPAPFLDAVFGSFDQQTFQRDGLFQFTEASIPRTYKKTESPPNSRLVTRTAIGAKGIADDQSLRTTEAPACSARSPGW